jgi:DNA-binding transcriptional LysR family regulator
VDLRQLRTFVAVADHRTVSAAAGRLHVAQPALSRQIHALEEELGLKLFERVRRRLVLTNEGEQLLAECRAILSAAASLGERAQTLRRGEHGVLRVAATPQTIDGVFSSFLPRFERERPSVQVNLVEAAGGQLVSMVERGDIHLAIALTGLLDATPGDHASMERVDLGPVYFLAAFSPGLKLPVSSGHVDIAQVASQPLLLLDSSFYVRAVFDGACRLARVKPKTVVLESRTPHALLALAEAGRGVAVVPSVLPTDRYALRVARITHRRQPLLESLTVLRDARRALPPYAKHFCDLLAKHAGKILSDRAAATAR